MSQNVYRYQITDPEIMVEAQATFDLALLGVQSLHGETRTRLDAKYASDDGKRAFVIDATTAVGESLNHLFAGYLRQEFGERGFHVQRLDRMPDPQAVAT
jgi:hypothetical protein